MKILGIISEYNPFHNGHLFHLKEALRLTGADAAVAVMSGDFVQRGAPAFADKYLRAQMALEAGISVVVELPVLSATASAEGFATGGISLLNALGCIDFLCFGSECGDLSLLTEAARILAEEPDGFQDLLRKELKKGQPFPAARKTALALFSGSPSMGNVLDSPNNILGVEYLKALQASGSHIRPFTLARQESGYHDLELSGSLASASSIRHAVRQTKSFPEEVLSSLPGFCARLLSEQYGKTFPIWENDLSLLLKCRLLQETAGSLCQYADISPGLANRIVRNKNRFHSWDSFVSLLKTRELTYTRISRGLLHILLGITKQDQHLFASQSCAPFARVLGFRKEQKDVLSKLAEASRIPLILRGADIDRLSGPALACLQKDLYASDLYASIQTDRSGSIVPPEFGRKLLVV